jgi:hypothetical protein
VFDTDGNGTIDAGEFCDFLEERHSGAKTTQDMDELSKQ